MKKFLLSAFVVIVFTGYVLRTRFPERGEEGVVINAPNLNTDSLSSIAGSTNTDSGSSTPPTNTNTGVTTNSANTNTGTTTAVYRDGRYTGSAADAFYGNIQVRATVSGGKLTDVQFLQYPNDRQNSVYINSQAMPILRQEALQAQSSYVDIVSGATDTSYAFQQSLHNALTQALN